MFEDRHAPGKRHCRAMVVDLEHRHVGRQVAAATEINVDRMGGVGSFYAGRVAQRFRRREAVAVRDGEFPGDGDELAVDAIFGCRLSQGVLPCPDDVANRRLQRLNRYGRRRTSCAADNEMHPGQAAFEESGIKGRDMAVEDGPEIIADAFANAGIIVVARHIDDRGDEAVEGIGADEDAHARTFAESENDFRVFFQQRDVDLEKLVAGIGFQHVDERLAGMVRRVETGLRHYRFRLEAQIGDRHDRARIGGRGEEADDPELALQLSLFVEGLDADVIEIDPAMDNGFHIRLGHDQRIGAGQEGADFGRRDDRFLAAPQHPHIRVLQYAEPRLVGALHGAAFRAAGVAIFAHAEESEIVVPQPFEEGDRLGNGRLFQRGVGISVFADRLVQPREHGAPVMHRQPHLLQNRGKLRFQRRRLAVGEQCHMDMDNADAIVLLAAVRLLDERGDARFSMFDGEDGVNDEKWLPGLFGDFGENRIEEEGHIVIDNGDGRHRPPLP